MSSIQLGFVLFTIAGFVLGTTAKTKCIPDMGCFDTGGDFFHLLYRPVSLLPRDREDIGTRFMLYTRGNPKSEDILQTGRTRNSSHLDPNRDTKFLVHGWIDNIVFADWMKVMKDELLLNGDYNVIITDWSGGNKPPYSQATANTRVVGAEIALLVQYLNKTFGLQPEKCHVIGHSLGAHVAGYAGERLKTLGRITGLDPAEPYFQSMPPSVRLDETDAQFVDVIHSDAKSILLLGFGMSQMVGHVDFFPNNGREHPGCSKEKLLSFATDGLMEGVRRFAACNHMRAIDFFIESINHNHCILVGYGCKDWKTFLDGKCTTCGSNGEKCAIMGLGAEQYRNLRNPDVPLQAFLKTNSKSQFCLYHYQVLVRLAKPEKNRDERGELFITIKGDKGSKDFKLSSAVEDLYHGSSYSYLVTTTENLGQLKSVTMKWKHKNTIYNPKTWNLFNKARLYIATVTVQPMNFVDPKERSMVQLKACTNAEMYSNEDLVLKACS